MTESKLTRCPGCATVFRITAGQLALREGQVRCGHCRAVFDANDHFVSLDEAQPAVEAAGEAQSTVEPAEATARETLGEEPVPVEEPGSETGHEVQTIGEEALTDQPTDDRVTDEAVELTAPDAPDQEVADASDQEPTDGTAVAPADAGIGAAFGGGAAERFQWKKKRKPRTVPMRVYAIAAVALIAGLLLQLVLEYRDALAAHVPATRPLLAAACRPLGCTIGPLRDGAALSIDASDLQADPAHRGLLLLSATIRNRAGHAIAFPYLELMLTDSSDRVVVRRAFPPAEYARGSADLAAGIPPNGEHVVRMFLDASATQQAGYRVYLFYP